MKVAVIGLWHLGSVTAACLAAANFAVLGYDPNATTIADLNKGQAPLFEPKLNELLSAGLASGKLRFSTDKKDISDADIVWVTFDTPVDDHDKADTEFVIEQVKSMFPYIAANTTVLVSSQLPVGSIQRLSEQYKKDYPNTSVSFACSPENLRLGKAIEVFTQPDRIVVGINTEQDKAKLAQLFAPFTQNIVWMSVASAEMTKHALNAFLAASVVFINELATLCEGVGADAREVERGLKSETRIGPGAYLRPGSAFAGGTLARDVSFLIQIGQKQQSSTKLFSAIIDSNQAHKAWAQRRLQDILGKLHGKTIAMLGLTYKAGTDTLRRSTAIETCRWLREQGAIVLAHDPAVKQLPAELKDVIQLQTTMQQALQGADAAVVATEWDEFNTLSADDFVTHLKQPLLFDPSGFLAKNVGDDHRIRYFTVGRQA